MDTMLSIKIDKTLKNKARETAQALGVSLNAVINQYIKEFVTARTITFVEYPQPNERTRHIIREAKKAMIAALKANQKNIAHVNLDKLPKS